MVSLLAGLQGVSTELYEAASIDGSNEFQKNLVHNHPTSKANHN
jgi:ABC-type sugar transport system permease subunit|tara:strand:+ start:1370 stop:1501 length:132 start_codon:yes stop_codon:yes gene_type:complete